MKFARHKATLSLKTQLLIRFALITFVPVCIIGIYYYLNLKAEYMKNIGEVNYKVISHTLDNIDHQIEQADSFADWIYMNTEITDLLNTPASNVNDFSTSKKLAIQSLTQQFQYMPVTKYIRSLFILGDNGMDLRSGQEAALVDTEDFMQTDWFKQTRETDGKIFWGSISPNYTDISLSKYIIPQGRLIKNSNNGKPLGYSIMLFDPSFFYDCYKEVLLNKDEKVYLTDSSGKILSSNQQVEPGASIGAEEYFTELLGNMNAQYFEKKIIDEINLITFKKSSYTNWILIDIIPLVQLREQKNFVQNTTVILTVSLILMGLILSFYLSENFTRPIKAIVKHVNGIAQGNFDKSVNLDHSIEIGELSNSVEKMKTDIKDLLHESVQKEKEKRIAEIRMLQSQINPHFLYNALNSVQMMARLQGAKGIEKMVLSLGNILKAGLSDLHEKIPLHEELGIIDDYIYIQKIRYKGRIQYEKDIKDESLLKCSIIKFILQPIVENAVLHGFGPKDGAGRIVLSVYRENDDLVIEVCDDGVGMSPDKIIMDNREGDPSNKGRGIGIANINQRIKLVYGDKYYLKFESVVGEYTKAMIVLPLEYCKNGQQ